MTLYFISEGNADHGELAKEFIEGYGHELVGRSTDAVAVIALVSERPTSAASDIKNYCLEAIRCDAEPYVIILYEEDTRPCRHLLQLMNDNDFIVDVCYRDTDEMLENILSFLEATI